VLACCGLALANVATIYDVSGAAAHNLQVPVPLALWVIIGVAGVAFILSFMGCCGALKESSCLLYSVRIIFCVPSAAVLTHFLFAAQFAVLLALILGVQLAIIGFAYYKQDDFKTEIDKVMNSTLYDYAQDKNGLAKKTWDALQTDVILSDFFNINLKLTIFFFS